MPASEQLGPNDAVLLRYLLGALPVDEAEPIEEASVVDEDFAARLNAMERDLVDSYVRGETGRVEPREIPELVFVVTVCARRGSRLHRRLLRIADAAAEDVSMSLASEGLLRLRQGRSSG